MPIQTVMPLKEGAAATSVKLRLLSLYENLPAAVRARWAAGAIARHAGPQWQISSETWKMSSLNVSEPIRQMIVNDVANADVIIIAASSPARNDPVFLQCLDSLEACKNNRSFPGLLVGLLGDDETIYPEPDCVVKLLMQCAQKMGWNFIWRWMGEDAMSDAGWLASNLPNLLVGKLAANEETVFF